MSPPPVICFGVATRRGEFRWEKLGDSDAERRQGTQGVPFSFFIVIIVVVIITLEIAFALCKRVSI